jgi:hypothetical protein
MRRRAAPEPEPELLDEDEQEALVAEIDAEQQQLERQMRMAATVALICMALACIFCFVAAANAPDTIAAPGEPTVEYALAHQRALALPRDRLQAAYAATAAVLLRAAVRVSAPADPSRLRHVLACVVAVVPALYLQPAWSDGRRKLVAAFAAAAPLGYALAAHVDADMQSLGKDVGALDGMRYRHKDV